MLNENFRAGLTIIFSLKIQKNLKKEKLHLGYLIFNKSPYIVKVNSNLQKMSQPEKQDLDQYQGIQKYHSSK